MADKKQKSKKAFNQQAATYDQDLRGSQACNHEFLYEAQQ